MQALVTAHPQIVEVVREWGCGAKTIKCSLV